MIREHIDATLFVPPATVITIDDQSLLTATEGYWPDYGQTFIHVPATQIQLGPSDNVVLVAREGGKLVAHEQALPYGLRPVGQWQYEVQPFVDLVAWREADGWHVKHLVQGGG